MSTKSDGSIVITVDLNDKDYESRLAAMEGKTKSFGNTVKNLVGAIGITKALASGWNMVKSSISSAMDRIDTMNQFTRVMTVMIGSTDEATAALEELKAVTKGTAYGLDVAAASTQKMVTSGMGIDKAVPQIATWADAVAFYGDGSNETFAGVTDAISKMTSKGKVEMDQLNRLFDAGIPAVEIYASYVGQSAQEVQDALSKGTISAQEFTDGLTEAMRNGTERFASIDGAAKEAGASWSATFDNMKAAVTRGMVNIIESIDEALTSNDLPTMREMIADVGKAFEKAMTFIADNLPKAIELMQQLAPFILAVGTAFATWKIEKTVGKATNSISGLLDLMKDHSIINSFLIKIGGGSSSFSKLASSAIGAGGGIKGVGKAIVSAMGGPVGMAITVISALVAAFIYLWNTSDEFRQFCYDTWDALAEFFSSVVNRIVEFFTITIPEAWESFKAKMAELVENVKTMFQDMWNSVVSFFTETIPSWIQSVIDWFSKLPYNIGYFIGQIIGQFVQWGIDLKNFITEDIPAFINSVIQWFQELPGRIWNCLCEALDKVKQWGTNTYNTGKEKVQSFVDVVVEWFRSLPGKIWAWLCDVVSKVIQWGTNLWNKGKEAASDLVSAIVDGVMSLPGKMLEIGRNIVTGLWDGIVGAKDWLFDQIGGFCDGIVDGIADFLGIHSPSRVLRDMVGRYLPPGIAVGFEMAMPDASKDMEKSARSMVNGLQREIDLSTSELSAGVSLEQSAQYSKQTSIINQFPKSFKLAGDGLQPITLVLDNGVEVAHALVEPLNKEFALQ